MRNDIEKMPKGVIIIFILLIVMILVVTFIVVKDNERLLEDETQEPEQFYIELPRFDEDTMMNEIESDTFKIDEAVEQTISLGEYILTAYCPCAKCCGEWAADRSMGILTASGSEARANRTVAVDPGIIPYGTVLIINGIEYIAEDCGGAIKGNRIDIYFDSHDEALQFGIQIAEVIVKRGLTK